MSVVGELQRRGVIRVLVGYLAAAWLLLQIADLVLPAYGFSPEAMATLITIVIIGAVPAAVLAWIFEWTPEGLVRDTGQAGIPESGRTLDRVIIGMLALAVIVFAVDKFVLDPARDEAREQAVAEQARSAAVIDRYAGRSIAVLPFVNRSADPEQAYFSDGIAEDVLNLLTKVRELRVIARSSSFRFRGEDVDLADVARQLNVNYILEGSVRRAGDKVRVTAQLIEVGADRQVWSERYDREAADIFEIQDEISAHIIDELKVELLGPPPKVYRTDPETYALFLRAKQQNMESGLRGDIAAYRLLQQVLERDPDYVPALTRIVSVASYLMNNGELSRDEAMTVRMEALGRALVLDPENGLAVAFSGWAQVGQFGDWAAAARLFEKGLSLAPNDPEVLRESGQFATALGNIDATLKLGKRSLERDPMCVNCYYPVVEAYIELGQLDEAEALARRRIALAPGAWSLLGDILLRTGDNEGALAAYDNMRFPSERAHKRLIGLAASGRTAEFEAEHAHWRAEYAADRPIHNAVILAWAGEIDAAFEQLENHHEDVFNPLAWGLPSNRLMFKPLWDDPRWAAIEQEQVQMKQQRAEVDFRVPDAI